MFVLSAQEKAKIVAAVGEAVVIDKETLRLQRVDIAVIERACAVIVDERLSIAAVRDVRRLVEAVDAYLVDDSIVTVDEAVEVIMRVGQKVELRSLIAAGRERDELLAAVMARHYGALSDFEDFVAAIHTAFDRLDLLEGPLRDPRYALPMVAARAAKAKDVASSLAADDATRGDVGGTRIMTVDVSVFASWDLHILAVNLDDEYAVLEAAREALAEYLQKERPETVADCGIDRVFVRHNESSDG